MHFLRLCFGLLLVFTSSVAQADLTEADRAFFLKNSYTQHSLPKPNQIDFIMYGLAEQASDVEEFVADFAARIDVSELQARQYAEAIIEATRFRVSCQETSRCRFEKGVALYTALTTAGLTDESGQVAVVIGK